jgi:hypothetical protein
MRNFLLLGILTVIFVACAARFMSLEASPPGFYIDEAAGAMNIICMATDGTSEAGLRHPLFFPEFSAFFTAPYIYFGAIWVKIFGVSIASFRSIPALFNLLTIAGLACLGFYFFGLSGSLFTALAASISPWSFTFSRIAWDPPLAPCFLIWSIYFFLKMKTYWQAFLSGALVSLAMYAYPPMRVQAPLLFGILGTRFIFAKCAPGASHFLRYHFAFLMSVVVVSIPLFIFTFNGSLQARFNMISIFLPSYLSQHPHESAVGILWRNILSHFSSNFLLSIGDANLRHSTRYSGELSWLDIAALGVGLIFLSHKIFRNSFTKTEGRHRTLFILIFVGIFAGILPAAMTWESIPHSLRAIGAWPFFALLTGLCLSQPWRSCKTSLQRNIFALGVLIISTTFAFGYGQDYFQSYPSRSFLWFDSDLKEKALTAQKTGDWSDFANVTRNYPDMAARYYLVLYGGDSCRSSSSHLSKLKR